MPRQFPPPRAPPPLSSSASPTFNPTPAPHRPHIRLAPHPLHTPTDTPPNTPPSPPRPPAGGRPHMAALELVESLSSKDTKVRLQAIHDATAQCEQLDAEDAPPLLDALAPALTDNNLKVAQGALSLLSQLLERLGHDLAPHVGRLWKPLVERLGDAKGQVKERAVDLAVLLASRVLSPAEALEHLAPAWRHKNWRTQESILLVVGRLLATQERGPGMRELLPQVVELLEHREPPVREGAALCVEQMARLLGPALLNELRRMPIRPNVLKPLLLRLGEPESRADAPADKPAERAGAERGGASTGAARPASPAMRREAKASSPKGGEAARWGEEGAADEEVAPLPVYSERELSKEMEAIREKMSNGGEWTVRQAALRQLQALVLGGAAEFDSFAAQLKTLREPLCAQVSELRSSLVKEATHALELLVTRMGPSFEPFAEVYVPLLLKGTVVTIQVISHSSYACARAIILHSTPVKCLPKLLAALSDRSSTIRKNAMEYILLLLEALPAYSDGERGPLEKHADALCQAVRAGVSDALAEVRSLSRSTFWALHRHFPSRANKVLASLDQSTHRLVVEEQQHYSAGSGARRPSAPPPRISRPAPPLRGQSTPALGLPSEVELPPPRCPSERDLCRGRAGSAPQRRVLADAQEEAAEGLSSQRRVVSSGARRVPSEAAKAKEKEKEREKEREREREREKERERERVEREKERERERLDRLDRDKERERERLEREGRDRERHVDDHLGYEVARENQFPAEDASELLIKTGSNAWSMRAQAFSELAALMGSERCSEVAPHCEKLAAAVLEKLNDSHYKVVQSALECTVALVARFPRAVEPLLERLLPQLLLREQETREATRVSAQGALQSLQQAFSPEALLHVLVRVLDVPTPRVRIGALGLISECSLAAPSYVAATQHLRPLLQKALAHLSDKNADVKRAAVGTLRVLHEVAGPVFVQQASQLPLPVLNSLKAAMREGKGSRLDADLAALAKPRPHSARSSTPPPHSHPPPPSHPPPSLPSHPPHPPHPSHTPHPSHPSHAPHPSLPPRLPSPPPREDGFLPDDASSRGAAPAASLAPPLAPRPPLQHQHAAQANAPPLKPEEWAHVMPAALRQLAAPAAAGVHREALLKVQKLVLCARPDAEVWSAHFEHVLEALLRSLQHDEPKLRELAAACLKDLLRALPLRFRAFTEHVLLRLLVAGRDESALVAMGAEEALELLLAASDAHRCMAVLVPVVMKEEPPTLQLAIRLTSKLVGRFTQLQLLSILPQILPPLFEAFKNPNADVRKAVVFCLVDMYMILGEQLTPHLTVLSTSQLKLVTIYINRTAKARADAIGGAPR
ncbi:hypothetical protein AB1Y20_016643 [Prymnesium parvum]|uniref:TOG domain-containing protein n=1 Tax=Prymnesium parvum TaxID=97485 RepID=A0AB34IAF4_PRYPA